MTTTTDVRMFDATMTAAAEDCQGNSTRSGREQEENVILAAWNNMSSALHWHSVCEDSADPGAAQSFLAKQRQSSQARRLNRLQPK